jgi:hypothetical protein
LTGYNQLITCNIRLKPDALLLITLPYASRLTPDALRLTPDASRLTPDALRLTPDALRLIPEIFLSTLANFINFVAFKTANILQYEKN